MGIDLKKLENELKHIEKNHKNEVKTLINFNNQKIEYIDNLEINEFLNNKSVELLSLIGNSNLYLGKIFSDVKDFLEKNLKDNETTYCKWLEINSFNRMTALRYRRRWDLYKSLEKEEAKKIIALAPQKIIDELVKNEIEILVLNEIKNLEELQNLLEKNSLNFETQDFNENIEMEDLKNKLSLINFEKIENLDSKKKKQLEIYLKKIEKILS